VNPDPARHVIRRTGLVRGKMLPTYRLYRLDGAGRISAGEWIEATGDDEARSIARKGAGSSRYELWHRSRLVERVSRDDE
jgi:hypothetical protein